MQELWILSVQINHGACAVMFCVHANVDPDTAVARKRTRGSTPVSPPAPAVRPVGVEYLLWKVNPQTHTLGSFTSYKLVFYWCTFSFGGCIFFFFAVFVIISCGIASHKHCHCQFVQQEIELPSLVVTDWSNWKRMQWEKQGRVLGSS